jgi:hypothetical protein
VRKCGWKESELSVVACSHCFERADDSPEMDLYGQPSSIEPTEQHCTNTVWEVLGVGEAAATQQSEIQVCKYVR